MLETRAAALGPGSVVEQELDPAPPPAPAAPLCVGYDAELLRRARAEVVTARDALTTRRRERAEFRELIDTQRRSSPRRALPPGRISSPRRR